MENQAQTVESVTNTEATESVAEGVNTHNDTSSPQPSVADRPSWLNEKFESGEELQKSYDELASKLGKKEEDIKNTLMQELETEAFANRPPSAGEYIIPDSLDAEEAGSNSMLKWWADYSWNNGLSQEEFDEGIAKFVEYAGANEPNLDEVKKGLGDNANARVEAVQLWMNKFFPDNDMQEAVATLGSSVGGIKALEKVIEATKGTSLNTETTPTGHITQEMIEAKMKDPRYWQQGKRDESFIAEVNNDWKKFANIG